jgi:DNA-binding transcriptional regulator YhcF (GntR family)
MLPFLVEIKPGLPITEQVLFAVKKAVVGGQLKPGSAFPSIRILSQELKINPNTAHKIVATLVSEGVLLTTPQVGSIVAPLKTHEGRADFSTFSPEVERLVVEARKLGLHLDELQGEVARQWKRLGKE